MIYENLLTTAEDEGVDVIDYNFNSERIKGLYCDGTIALSENLHTATEKACVLAEELGHYYTSVGDILNQAEVQNRKQELHARMWGYNRLIGLQGIVDCYKAGCRTLYDMAEHLEVTEEFLAEALENYRKKYGLCKTLDNYVIYFEPSLSVFELI